MISTLTSLDPIAIATLMLLAVIIALIFALAREMDDNEHLRDRVAELEERLSDRVSFAEMAVL